MFRVASGVNPSCLALAEFTRALLLPLVRLARPRPFRGSAPKPWHGAALTLVSTSCSYINRAATEGAFMGSAVRIVAHWPVSLPW
jgi:hypothetical protein